LERREGELKNTTAEEIAAIQQRIGHPAEGRTIRLKDGAQAYTATFYGQPELAKKNPKKIFWSVNDGGSYDKDIFLRHDRRKGDRDQNVRRRFVRKFSGIRRKVQASDELQTVYEPILGKELAAKHSDVIHQVMAQCSLFLCGTIFKDLVDIQKRDPSSILDVLAAEGSLLIQTHLLNIIDYAKNNKDKADRSWPVLLKSNAFFTYITAYLAGIRKGTS
jgi:hypothetical protein